MFGIQWRRPSESEVDHIEQDDDSFDTMDRCKKITDIISS